MMMLRPRVVCVAKRGVRALSSINNSQFWHVHTSSNKNSAKNTVTGVVLDQSIDLQRVRPGEEIDVPYQLTLGSSMRDFWQSAFYCHDRINTSTPFARSLGLQDQVVPFSFMLFLAGSMSHADHAKVQIGFSDAVYHWPAFAGDTLTKKFVIRSLRSVSSGKQSVARVGCELRNQKDVTVFSCEKQMMFPFPVPPSDVEVQVEPTKHSEAFLRHIIDSSETLSSLGSQTFTSMRPGQLILHTLMRPISPTHSMQLSMLARITHPRHFNTKLYSSDELLVPGGLVFAMMCSLASRDLHEVLYEDLVQCLFPNELCPGECMSAMTFVKAVGEHVNGDLEAIDIRTIGIKNVEVESALRNKELPLELFTGKLTRPAALEELLKQEYPDLQKKIVCIADRRVYRQAPKHTPFLL